MVSFVSDNRVPKVTTPVKLRTPGFLRTPSDPDRGPLGSGEEWDSVHGADESRGRSGRPRRQKDILGPHPSVRRRRGGRN